MKKDELYAKLVEIDEKIRELDERLMAAKAVRTSYSIEPREIISKDNFKFLSPIARRKARISSFNVLRNIQQRSRYLEYAKKLEGGKSTVDFYLTLQKFKGLHPEEFNEPEFIKIREKFESLPEEIKQEIASEVSKLWEIAISNEYSTVVLNYTIEKTLEKLEKLSEKPSKKEVKKMPEISETPVQKALREEWLSKGYISANFMKELHIKFPEADIADEIQKFIRKKKLSDYMVEPIPKELVGGKR